MLSNFRKRIVWRITAVICALVLLLVVAVVGAAKIAADSGFQQYVCQVESEMDESSEKMSYDGPALHERGKGRLPMVLKQQVKYFTEAYNHVLLGYALLFLALGAGLSWWISRSITRPIQRVTAMARRIGQGELGLMMAVTSHDEIGILAMSINEMSVRLKESAAVQKRFSADMIHELRTPLTVIQGNLEGIADNLIAADSATINLLIREVSRLSALTSELRDLSLAECDALTLNYEREDMAELLEGITSLLRPLFDEQGVTLLLTAEKLKANVDRQRCAQIFNNLVMNALQHTKSGEVVKITVASAERDGVNGVAVSVADNGCGIAVEDLPNIFEHFYKTDKSRTKRGAGSGIGLAVVRAHRGTITVDSKVGEGSEFKVWLPEAGVNAEMQNNLRKS